MAYCAGGSKLLDAARKLLASFALHQFSAASDMPIPRIPQTLTSLHQPTNCDAGLQCQSVEAQLQEDR